MTALQYIFLVLFIMGLLTAVYYAMICYPVFFSDPIVINNNNNSEVPENERSSLLQSSDLTGAIQKQPKAQAEVNPASEQNQNASPNAPASEDQIDASQASVPSNVNPEGSPKSHTVTASVNHSRHEGSDKEDGLLQTQNQSINKPENDGTPPYPLKPVGFTTPTVKKTSSEVCVPIEASHVVVTMPQPQTVPAAQNMSVSHPPSQVVVTTPQPLNHPPIVVAPVYDEPSIDEQPSVSLHHQIKSNSGPIGWKEDISCSPALNKAACQRDALSRQETVPLMVDDDSKKSSPKDSATELSSDTDTSDPEIHEYHLHSGQQVHSAKAGIADEISIETGVVTVKYSKINNSTNALNTNGKHSPDLNTSRRSPDGVSVKSLEEESAKAPSPSKEKKSLKPASESEML